MVSTSPQQLFVLGCLSLSLYLSPSPPIHLQTHLHRAPYMTRAITVNGRSRTSRRWRAGSINHTLYTLHSTPYTLHPTPYPYTLKPKSQTLTPKP